MSKEIDYFAFGDLATSVLESTRIKKVAESATISMGKKCNCEERRKRLNELGRKMQEVWGIKYRNFS